jgi:hypothetical protein
MLAGSTRDDRDGDLACVGSTACAMQGHGCTICANGRGSGGRGAVFVASGRARPDDYVSAIIRSDAE